MEPWVLFALAASSIQTARNMLQKSLAVRISASGAAYARFLFGLPFAFLAAFFVATASNEALPTPKLGFFAYVVFGALSQGIGSALFIHLISRANFAISLTFSKTETVLAAVISFLLLGEVLSLLGTVGIVVTVLGCMVLAAGRQHLGLRTLLMALDSSAALQGIAVGAIYATTSITYRAALLELEGGAASINAAYTLCWVMSVQVVGFGAVLALRERTVLVDVVRAWKPAIWIGLTGVASSGAWLMAFALKEAAYVVAVSNFDLVLAYLVSRFLYREHTNKAEIAGILITIAGIMCVVVAR